jgi:hypothetical protein
VTINTPGQIGVLVADRWNTGALRAATVQKLVVAGDSGFDAQVRGQTGQGGIGVMKIIGSASGDLDAGFVQKAVVTGNLDGAHWTLGNDYSLGVLVVGGQIVNQSQVIAAGHIFTVKTGGVNDSDIFAGVPAGEQGPALPADDAASFDLNAGIIDRLIIKGSGATDALAGSRIGAAHINVFAAIGADMSDPDRSSQLGAQSVGKAILRLLDGRSYRWNNNDWADLIGQVGAGEEPADVPAGLSPIRVI